MTTDKLISRSAVGYW